jgi:hypothetical protein
VDYKFELRAMVEDIFVLSLLMLNFGFFGLNFQKLLIKRIG